MPISKLFGWYLEVVRYISYKNTPRNESIKEQTWWRIVTLVVVKVGEGDQYEN